MAIIEPASKTSDANIHPALGTVFSKLGIEFDTEFGTACDAIKSDRPSDHTPNTHRHDSIVIR